MILLIGGNLWLSIMLLVQGKGGACLYMIKLDTMPLVYFPRQLGSVLILLIYFL